MYFQVTKPTLHAYFIKLVIFIIWTTASSAATSNPFSTCPTEAYLIQTPRDLPITFGVDLSTGSYRNLSQNMGTEKVNGIGFSIHDNYMYGWDYGAGTLARFGSDYQAEPLVVNDLIGKNFYVGDVALKDNAWYGYRPNSGLYRISLEQGVEEYSLQRIATASYMGNPKITDFAFHPLDKLIYSVDNNGYLLSIDPATGLTTTIIQVLSESELEFNFTFGAQYFDVQGNLYISNNGNGFIYKINIDGIHSTANFFTYGPSSSSNDGARCALAPVIIQTAVDFGDAPDTYGTSLEKSGARHALSQLYLGEIIDGEANAYVNPLNDDSSDQNDDEDGVSFITGIEIGETALINVHASQSGGFLNAWIDWDHDGVFNEDEKIISERSLLEGDNFIEVSVPVWAHTGDTWSRFRISSTQSLGPTGGVSDGEVEDYPVMITETGVLLSYYPGSNSYTSFAFEDLYPDMGDFDMNDVIVNLRITEFIRDGKLIRIRFDAKLAALGASYHNGFAIELLGIAPEIIKSDSIVKTMNGHKTYTNLDESDSDNATIILSNDLWNYVSSGEQECNYFRTERGCETSVLPHWSVIVPLTTPVIKESVPTKPYNPFIFSTAGYYHGDTVLTVTGTHPGRGYEVHMKNYPPTGI